MKTAMKLALLVAMWLACAASTRFQGYKAMRVHVAATDSDVYTAAVRVLGDEGYGLRTQDRESGLVVTEWETAEFGIGNYKHAWRVTVADGDLRVAIDCQTLLPNGPFESGERYGSCGEGSGRHPDWVAKQPRIRDSIISESERIARKRSQGGEGQ